MAWTIDLNLKFGNAIIATNIEELLAMLDKMQANYSAVGA
jgi:hypothetical protein